MIKNPKVILGLVKLHTVGSLQRSLSGEIKWYN